jgi:hypothetical protein
MKWHLTKQLLHEYPHIPKNCMQEQEYITYLNNQWRLSTTFHSITMQRWILGDYLPLFKINNTQWPIWGISNFIKLIKDTPSLHMIECEQKLHCVPDTTHFKMQQKRNKSLEPTQFPVPHSLLSIKVGIAYRQCCASHLDRMRQNITASNITGFKWAQKSTNNKTSFSTNMDAPALGNL